MNASLSTPTEDFDQSLLDFLDVPLLDLSPPLFSSSPAWESINNCLLTPESPESQWSSLITPAQRENPNYVAPDTEPVEEEPLWTPVLSPFQCRPQAPNISEEQEAEEAAQHLLQHLERFGDEFEDGGEFDPEAEAEAAAQHLLQHLEDLGEMEDAISNPPWDCENQQGLDPYYWYWGLC